MLNADGEASALALMRIQQQLRVDISQWETLSSWGPESEWNVIAEEYIEMCAALPSKDNAKRELANLFKEWDDHAKRGRELIWKLKTLTCDLEPMSLVPSAKLHAIFLDGFTMLVTVVSEVKFFEIITYGACTSLK